jgi:hypothetical protein
MILPFDRRGRWFLTSLKTSFSSSLADHEAFRILSFFLLNSRVLPV